MTKSTNSTEYDADEGNTTTNYKEVAQRLNCSFRVGRYGVKLLGRKLNGGVRLFSVTKLEGWIFDPEEIIEAIRLDDELGIKNVEEK